MNPQPTPGLCASCRAGDHQHHQPAFGGICIGCVCPWRHHIAKAVGEIPAADPSCRCTQCKIDHEVDRERDRLRALVLGLIEGGGNVVRVDALLALFEVAE